MGNIAAKRKINELIQASDEASLQQCMHLLQQCPTIATDRKSPRPGTTIWHLAASNGNPAALLALLDFVGSSPSSPWAGLPPERRQERLRVLLDDGNTWGLTPMSICCAGGDDVSTTLLLSLGASCFCRDSNGQTAAHHAAREGHVQCLRTLLDSQQNENARRRLQDISNVSGLSALHYAVAKGRFHCVQLLLESGAGLSPRSRTFTSELGVILPAGSTPLHIAARLGLEEIVTLMLRHLATERRASHASHDIRLAEDGNGRIPLQVANTRVARQATGMLHMLDPETDLLHMFSVQELALPVTGIVRLSIIAAAALQTKLLADLQRPPASQPPPCSAPSTSAPGSTSCNGPLERASPSIQTSGSALFRVASLDVDPRSSARSRSRSKSGASPRPSSETCALCLADSALDLQVDPCGHGLCSSCAMQLIIRVIDKPPLCPFCRSPIASFRKVQSAQAPASRSARG